MICGGPDVTPPTYICSDMSTWKHTLSGVLCSGSVSVKCISSSNTCIVVLLCDIACGWLASHIYHAPKELSLTAIQSNGLFFQKLLGNDLFLLCKHRLQGCRSKSQSTYERFSNLCIVLTKMLITSVGMRRNYIHPFCTLEIVEQIRSVSAGALSVLGAAHPSPGHPLVNENPRKDTNVITL